MRAALLAAALAAAAALPAYADCDSMLQVISPDGRDACVTAPGAHKLLERGWSHAPYSLSVMDTVSVASAADSLRPSDSVVARVLEGFDLTERTRQLIHDSYAYTQQRTGSLTESDKAWLREHPHIRVAYEWLWPPLEYDDGGRIGGLTAAYIEKFEEFTGSDFIPVHAMTITDGVNKIRSGEADVSFMAVDSDKRLDYMYFTDAHTALSANLVTYGEREMTVDDLYSASVGTVRGTEVEEWLDSRHRDLDYTSLHDYGVAFEALRDGRIDVLLESWIVASHIAATVGFEGLHNAGPAGHISQISIGCSKADLALCRILDKMLASVPEPERERMLVEAIADSEAHGGAELTDEIEAAVHEAYLSTKQTIDHLTEDEREWLAGRDEIRVVYESQWQPIEFAGPDGSLAGLSGRYAEAFSEFTGVRFVPYQTDSWAAGMAHVADGRADVSLMIVENDDRRRTMGFTEPHTVLAYNLVTYGESSLGPDDIGHIRVGTIRGYEIETWLDLHHPGVEYVSLASHELAFQALEDGRIDAMVEVWPVVSHIARDVGFELHNAGPLGRTMDLAVAYTKTEPELADIMTKALNSIPTETREEMLVEALVGSYVDVAE